MLAVSDRRDLLLEGGDMMDAVRQYIISIIYASVVCAVFKGFLGKSASSRLIKLLCGMLLLFTFLKPLKQIDLPDIIGPSRWNEDIANEAIRRGEELSQNAMADIISTKLASYVEEKATELGAEVWVEIKLSDEEIPAPVGIDIAGQVSPYVRSLLETYIMENIGLDREDVRWTGQG